MANYGIDGIKQQALALALENKRAEPGIVKVYWFPDNVEVRLIEVGDIVPPTMSGSVEPFYFDPSLEDSLPAPSGVALIRPDEVRELKLPEDWGSWDQAEELSLR